MKETKFYQFMSSLSPVEMNRLSKFLESPYFNKNEKLLKIYYSVEANIRDTKPSELSKTAIWDQIYPQVKYDDEKFRKHCTQLMTLSEKWLAQEVYEKYPLQEAKFLLEAVHEKQIEKLYSSATATALLNINRQKLKPANYYLNVYEIESLLYKLEKIEDKRIDKKNISKINLENLVNNLDYFYIAEKLKYYCTILSWSKISTIKDKSLFIDEIINIAEQSEFANIPPIAIYLKIYYTYSDSDNESHYYELKKLIYNSINLFPKEESKKIMEAAINYAISKTNQRIEKYLIETFELYQSAIQNELLLLNNELSQWTFKNIIQIALNLKEFEWTESFIENYSLFLKSDIRNNAITYNKALLSFYKGDFLQVLNLLQKVQYEELYYNLYSKVYLICSFFELDEYNALNSAIDSLSIFLHRNNNISKIQKNSFLNFTKYINKIANSTTKTKKELQNYKTELEILPALNKTWLLEKIDEQILVAKPDPPKKKKKQY